MLLGGVRGWDFVVLGICGLFFSLAGLFFGGGKPFGAAASGIKAVVLQTANGALGEHFPARSACDLLFG